VIFLKRRLSLTAIFAAVGVFLAGVVLDITNHPLPNVLFGLLGSIAIATAVLVASRLGQPH
jgi:hypothetical protein